MKPTLVIMAAGMGSRYGGLKQIDPVGTSGEIVIDYALYDAIRAGFGRAVFVIRRDIEDAFRAAIEPRLGGRIPVAYAFQERDDLPEGFAVPEGRAKPWGTGQAILACRRLVREPFAVINADDFYGPRSFGLLADFLRQADPARSAYALVGYVLRNTLSDHGAVTRAVCRDDGAGRLAAIVERAKIEKDGPGARFRDGDAWAALTGDERVSMNMFGFTPSLFGHLEQAFREFLAREGAAPGAEFLIPTVVGDLIARHRATVDILPTPESWLGVTYPEDKPAVVAGIRKRIAEGTYPERLWDAPPAPAS